MIKTCPICKSQFETSTKMKYCSEKCRYLGERQARKAWEERTDFSKKQQEKRQAERDAKHEEMAIAVNQRNAELDRIRVERLKADKQNNSDYSVLMQEAQESGDSLAYWKYYALREIEESENAFGRKSTRTVNDISVYNVNFPQLVIRSIDRLGVCIQKENGLGRKIR